MSVPVHCPHCGLSFTSRALSIGSVAGLTLKGNRETCPNCGKLADIQDGTYHFVDGALASFRKADQEQLERFRSLAAAAKEGSLSPADAVRQSDEVLEGFGRLLTLALQWGIPGLLIAILSFYLQLQAAHDDAITTAEIIRQLTAAQQTNEQLLEEVKRLELIEATPAETPKVTASTSAMRLVHSGPNRHERRKAAKQRRR